MPLNTTQIEALNDVLDTIFDGLRVEEIPEILNALNNRITDDANPHKNLSNLFHNPSTLNLSNLSRDYTDDMVRAHMIDVMVNKISEITGINVEEQKDELAQQRLNALLGENIAQQLLQDGHEEQPISRLTSQEALQALPHHIRIISRNVEVGLEEISQLNSGQAEIIFNNNLSLAEFRSLNENAIAGINMGLNLEQVQNTNFGAHTINTINTIINGNGVFLFDEQEYSLDITPQAAYEIAGGLELHQIPNALGQYAYDQQPFTNHYLVTIGSVTLGLGREEIENLRTTRPIIGIHTVYGINTLSGNNPNYQLAEPMSVQDAYGQLVGRTPQEVGGILSAHYANQNPAIENSQNLAWHQALGIATGLTYEQATDIGFGEHSIETMHTMISKGYQGTINDLYNTILMALTNIKHMASQKA